MMLPWDETNNLHLQCCGIPSLKLLIFLFHPHSHAVMFEIELINLVDHQAADTCASLSWEDREQATVEQLFAVANVDREVCFPFE